MLVSSNGTQVILMLFKSVFWTFTSEKKGPSPEMASRALKGSPNVTINDIVLFNSTGLTDTTPFGTVTSPSKKLEITDWKKYYIH